MTKGLLYVEVFEGVKVEVPRLVGEKLMKFRYGQLRVSSSSPRQILKKERGLLM
jgi:hypothetical protein